MAVDTFQKRMSATHLSCPWRGPLVDATEVGFNVGNRQAADYMYSGIASGAVAPSVLRPMRHWRWFRNR